MRGRVCDGGQNTRVAGTEAVAHLSLTSWVLTLQPLEEGPQRDARARSAAFISGENRGIFLPLLSVLLSTSVSQFANSIQQRAPSRGLNLDRW